MDQLFGLPAHPLLIHFPLVAIPVLSLLALWMLFRPRFHRRFAKPILALGVVTAVATIFAAQSGQTLLDGYSNPEFAEEHQRLGEWLRLFVIALVVAILGLVVVTKRRHATGRDPLSLLMSVIVAVTAVLSLVWTIRTGHEGAKLTWG